MADALLSRGPDDRGAWVDAPVGVALGHRRLSIVDLSPHGAQPMVSACGRYVIVYNGEIYDSRELRDELGALGSPFRGHSDTEVLLEAISRWGVDDAVRRCNGMFAFAVWDRQQRTLTLARDRLGKKPLYYGQNAGRFVFGSELKALCMAPDFEAIIDRDALALFVRFSYVPASHCIYRGIHKLPPGSLLTIRADGTPDEDGPRSYWSARELAESAEQQPTDWSDGEATDALDALLCDSVERRMVADVAVGATLSGGIDSATVVALMGRANPGGVRTFSIGYDDPKFDEAEHAKAIANHLGTEHTELIVTHTDALDIIPRLPQMYDEPFADTSQIPTALVCQMARRDVVVALSGDGGDELFAGYNRYFAVLKRWPGIERNPEVLRRAASKAGLACARLGWRLAGSAPRAALAYGGRLERNAERLAATSLENYYMRRASRCMDPSEFVLDADPPQVPLADPLAWASISDPLQRMMTTDLACNLPDQFLVKLDRASMSQSLEVRSPLLDHRLVEFSLRLPRHLKVRDGERKWILRQVLDRYVPRALTDRPKHGFSAPVDEWLQGPLRDWAEVLLDERRLRQEGYLNADAVRRVWQQHLAGWRDHKFLLWNLLMFQSWLEQSDKGAGVER
jgi:asparagine synthase (glutamine-hydrolysing)